MRSFKLFHDRPIPRINAGPPDDTVFVRRGMVIARRGVGLGRANGRPNCAVLLVKLSSSPWQIAGDQAWQWPIAWCGKQAADEAENAASLPAHCGAGCRGKYWSGMRAACEPLFHRSALESYAPPMNNVGPCCAPPPSRPWRMHCYSWRMGAGGAVEEVGATRG